MQPKSEFRPTQLLQLSNKYNVLYTERQDTEVPRQFYCVDGRVVEESQKDSAITEATSNGIAPVPLLLTSKRLRKPRIKQAYWAEPFQVPDDYCVVKKKKYAKGVYSTYGRGIQCLTTRSLNTASVLNETNTVLTLTYRMFLEENVTCIQSAKRMYHVLQKFFSNRENVFGTSKFVRQYLRVLSIMLRMAKQSAKLPGRPLRGKCLERP